MIIMEIPDIFIEKSFDVTFILLLCTTLLTSLASVQPKLENKQDIIALQLSSFVTAIASIHYYLMRSAVKGDRVIYYRYLDWFFTTPILLMELCILLKITDTTILKKVVFWNTCMLFFGFLGEINILSRRLACGLGFLCFGILYNTIYKQVERNNKDPDNKKGSLQILHAFMIVWSVYGLVFLFNDEAPRIVAYNVLDLCTKALFGVFIYLKTLDLKSS